LTTPPSSPLAAPCARLLAPLRWMSLAAAISALTELSSSGLQSNAVNMSTAPPSTRISGMLECEIANTDPNRIVCVAPVVLWLVVVRWRKTAPGRSPRQASMRWSSAWAAAYKTRSYSCAAAPDRGGDRAPRRGRPSPIASWTLAGRAGRQMPMPRFRSQAVLRASCRCRCHSLLRRTCRPRDLRRSC
jgi:hypothetical protein